MVKFNVKIKLLKNVVNRHSLKYKLLTEYGNKLKFIILCLLYEYIQRIKNLSNNSVFNKNISPLLKNSVFKRL